MSRPLSRGARARRRREQSRRKMILEALEPRNPVTSLAGTFSLVGISGELIAATALRAVTAARMASVSAARATRPHRAGRGAAPIATGKAARGGHHAIVTTPHARRAGDWLNLTPSPSRSTAQPGSAGGGGGSNHGAISRLRPAPPARRNGDFAANGVVTAAPGSTAKHAASPTHPGGSNAHDKPAKGHAPAPRKGTGGGVVHAFGDGGSVVTKIPNDALPIDDPGGGVNAAIIFSHFPLYTLDFYKGVVVFPNFVHQATLSGLVDLRAQVRDTTGVTFSWDTSGLTDAVSISGANTYHLTFQWKGNVSTATTDTVTLTATNASSQTEVQTYSFRVPKGKSSLLDSGTTWPELLPGNLVRPEAPAFASHYVTVDAASGALDATIVLPSYSPNIPPIALTYDSVAADPRPIMIEHHVLDDSKAVPDEVSAQLTFNGSAGSTYWYDTSQFTAGDYQQIAVQADATSTATGRYSISLAIGDKRGGTTTTTTVNENAIVLNESGNSTYSGIVGKSIGAGWTIAGLQKITSATGGVILSTGEGGRVLWFSGSGTFTSPAGEFSTLVQNGDNTYTRTMPDGAIYRFDSSGRMTSVANLNGLRVTYTYDGSSKLTSITDPYGKIATLSYDAGGKLQAITDTAGRVTTITHSGNNLESIKLPDNALYTLTYDGSGRLTNLKDPNSKTVTIAYDSNANRVGTITRPDNTTQTFTPYQVMGYGTSTNSASPGAATLLAEARATHTDPNSHVTDLRPDWNGMGLINQVSDADGNISSANRTSTGLATITIDRLNRVTTYSYDASGNVTAVKHPDGNKDQFTYNGFAEVTQYTDANNHSWNYTFDGEGNLTGIQDPIGNRTTLTVTANGFVETVKDARSKVTSYQYDSQDRLATITFPSSGTPTNKFAYDSYGNVATVTDERGNSTTYSYDARNRLTGTTDALGNKATFTYDSGGNLTQQNLPAPSGQTRLTTLGYDSMNRVATITDPLSHNTVLGYDSGGNLKTQTDPLARVATLAYDAEDRLTTITDPLGHNTVRTLDAEGQVTRVSDREGRVSTITYNSRGWVATETDPLGKITTYGYTATGKISTKSDPDVPGVGPGLDAYTYDNDDRPIAVSDGLGNLTTTVYDEVGNVSAHVDALGHRTTFQYDALNRLTTITDALSHDIAIYGYDSGGNVTSVTDALSHTTNYGFDALNRVTTITDALSGVTTIAFDEAGRTKGLTDPVGNATAWAYDAADRLTTITHPVGTTTFSYDNGNQLTDQTDRNSKRITFAYDSSGRRISERWLDASGGTVRTITYTYDNDDEMTGARDPDAVLTFTYDSGGNVTAAGTSGGGTGQPSVTLTYGYNGVHQRTSMTDNLASVGRTTYQYDDAHRLTTLTRTLGGSNAPNVIFGYDAADRLTSESRTIGGSGTAVNTTFSYDNADRLTTLIHSVGGGAVLATHIYTYDNASRLTNENNAEGLATYSYDNTDQLTGADRTGTSNDESYVYDANGNRDTTGYTTGSDNRMTASPGYTYTYDSGGNTSAKTETATGKVTTYSYDHRSRMTGVTQKDSKSAVIMQATYTYDALNRRIKTEVDADGAGGGSSVVNWTAYDGMNPYADFDSGGTLATRYLYGPAVDELFARTTSGGTSAWYLTDHLGSVRDIANTSGTIIDHVAYNAFGVVTIETSPTNGDGFKYTSKPYDPNAKLQYNINRYYDATTGRWTQEDPIGFAAGDFNLYRYVSNSQLNWVDTDGLDGDPPGGWEWPVLAFFKAGSYSVLNNTAGWIIPLDDLWATGGRFNKNVAHNIHDSGATSGAGQSGLETLQQFDRPNISLGSAHDHDGKLVSKPLAQSGMGAAETFSAATGIVGAPFRGPTAPAEAFKHLKKYHGLDPTIASNRLHKLKDMGGLNPSDSVVIGRTGDVYNAVTGSRLGTLTDKTLGTGR